MYQCSVPCLMGLEGLVADELRFGGFEGVQAENGRVLFSTDAHAVARANVALRCGERVLLVMGSFAAATFDQLFEGVKALPWEQLIGPRAAFPVKGYSIKSQLHSVPACQSIVKKAVVDRLMKAHGVPALPESGPRYQIQFALQNDRAELYLDTTGAPLYRRGYKLEQNEASIRETLAAAMVKLARYKGREPFIDPMCGSGTLAIEAALAALGIAPGANRAFDGQDWEGPWSAAFAAAKSAAAEAAQDAIARRQGEPLPITAMDNDPRSVALTRDNARRAGVGHLIAVEQGDALTYDYPETGLLMCNPPYGKRLLDVENARALYAALGRQVADRPALKKYIISSDETFETCFGQPAKKRRKLYNGMIKCNLHMYY